VGGLSVLLHREKCKKPMDFGLEDLVKAKLFIKVCKKSRGKAYVSIENVQISQLKEVKLKSENHKIMFHKAGQNLIKNLHTKR
jgi:hypothetical protein